ncbi:hypothetical protein GB931_11215 [Modestobacter sp. I12A-02628]|uniref:Uncharacterized protein n=1 Tax=Goekera deserti TaxID=2497753 RepID=A0A7K3WEW6_9ACTN|nr:hypothetical protein [Goekera deserti]MPQ98475.1 hypothetical protein [Goekera deserti]NDI48304.1 hypothetical protein [Goekera deserti]NEL54053.1 hypothetical protein [Goekera deserti]
MSDDLICGDHLLRRDGDTLAIGRRTGDDVVWLDDVAIGLLPEPARAALERGDTDDAALTLAVRSIVQAEVERGG